MMLINMNSAVDAINVVDLTSVSCAILVAE
jgi:hypothetical protein